VEPERIGVGVNVTQQGSTLFLKFFIYGADSKPTWVAARLLHTADPLACPPDLSIYAFFPSVSNGSPQECVGGVNYNGFNGRGQVNALTAVSP